MKKAFLISAMTVLVCAAGYAQSIMVVNTEKVFKAIPSYEQAMTTLDNLAKQYQKNIDDAYAKIEEQYNQYVAQKAYMSEASRRASEDAIIANEKKVAEYQETTLGPEGELMKKRVELVKPIQDKVFEAINQYAKVNNYSLVLDIATNPTILYYAPQQDKTDEIIKQIK